MRNRAYTIVRALAVTDSLWVAAALAISWQYTTLRLREFFLLLLVVPAWIFLLRYFGLYESHRLQGSMGATRAVLTAQVIGTGVLGTACLMLNALHAEALLKFALISTGLILVQRWVVYIVLHLLRRRGFDLRQVLLIGERESVDRIAESFHAHPEWGMQLCAVGVGHQLHRQYFTYPENESLDNLEGLLCTRVVDEILINLPAAELPAERAAFEACQQYGLLGRVLLEVPADPVASQLQDFPGTVSLPVNLEREQDGRLMVKRALDIIFGSIILLLLLPVMTAVGMLVKLSSPGPMLYRQKRAGWHGRDFWMLKFRTMIDGADSLQASLAQRTITGGPIYKNPNDWRMTPIGRVLRRFSLDELPQLLNVIKGDMSLVGPRPLPLAEAKAITGAHRRRFAMRPGITCLWQVNGRSNVDFTRWMQYDLQYVDSWSFWLDAKLLLKTVPAVLSGKGAY